MILIKDGSFHVMLHLVFWIRSARGLCFHVYEESENSKGSM